MLKKHVFLKNVHIQVMFIYKKYCKYQPIIFHHIYSIYYE
jgi:hypothetical protein